ADVAAPGARAGGPRPINAARRVTLAPQRSPEGAHASPCNHRLSRASGTRTSVAHTSPGPSGPPTVTRSPKYFRWKYSATFTSAISTGTSTSGPITAANAAPCAIPNVPTATAIASSKLLLAAVNDSVTVFE